MAAMLLATACGGGAPDQGCASAWWFPDGDGDGYGGDGDAVRACVAPTGHADRDGDCDDGEPAVHPGASESCDGVDQDCDGLVDDAPADGVWAYSDGDGDGYGAEDGPFLACAGAAGATDIGGDCNDSCDSCWSGHDEVCGDGVDNDCDGQAQGCGWEEDVLIADVGWMLVGASANQELGGRLATVDLDGDGADELLLSGDRGAELWLFHGPFDSDLPSRTPDAILTDSASLTSFPTPLAAVGDLDGNGVAGFAVGGDPSGGESDADAAIWLIAGPVSADAEASDLAQARLGFPTEGYAMAVSSAGDVDGDGIGDVLVGVPGDSALHLAGGAAFVFAGPVSGWRDADDSDASWRGDHDMDLLGNRVALAGDTDGDGLPELLLATQEDPDDLPGGRVYLVRGSTRGAASLGDVMATFTPETDGDGIGRSLCGPVDGDGDGLADVVIGGAERGEDPVAWLQRGPISGAVDLGAADLHIGAQQNGGLSAESMACGPDVDGDGRGDLLLGAPAFEADGYTAGGALLFTDLTGFWLHDDDGTAFVGLDNLGETYQIGSGVALAELDGTAGPDLVVTAREWHDGVVEDAGAVWVIPGANP